MLSVRLETPTPYHGKGRGTPANLPRSPQIESTIQRLTGRKPASDHRSVPLPLLEQDSRAGGGASTPDGGLSSG